jgi:membrane protein implicated in regulation of membrane protease activity
VDGAWWTAETPGEPIRAGEMVEVKAVRGLRLLVEKR